MEDILSSGTRRPIQKRAGRSWTKAARTAFLTELAHSCNVRRAVDVVGMAPSGAYKLRKRDPAFADLWAEALEIGYERLENALLEHALIGVNAIDMDAVVDAADARAEAALPGTGFSPKAMTPATVQLAMLLLNRHRAPVDGRANRGSHGVATPAETDAALKKHLDALARKLNAGKPEGRA